MAIFYIDPVAGNDANSGVNWANAWKTFANGPTAARIAPGDEMRIAKSPDPTTVGTATWTNRKIGNSITFDTAPTKVIDTMETGWVSSGAGSTVTNSQSTAYMMWGTTPGTGSTMQYVTSATTNGAYKNLGSIINYSAYQQVCFWFRTTAALDCTGAQNFTVRLCSDTTGATVVNTMNMPKWNYSANTWYPIVIDYGSTLGSNIQSVSFVTTNNTSQTFYLDELFASPASGLTLWSLIEDNDNTWYPIRTIRNNDVWLMGAFSASSAAGGIGTVAFLDTAWIGTTANFSTRKRETTKAYAATGPAATVWGQTNEAGTWTAGVKILNQYKFGYDTATNLQDGHTYIDNLVQLGTGISFTSHTGWRIERLIPVRFTTGLAISTPGVEFDKVGAIGCSSTPISLSSFSNSTVWPAFNKTFEILSITGNNGPLNLSVTSSGYSPSGAVFNFSSNIWGNQGVLSVSAFQYGIFNFKNILATGSTSVGCLLLTSGSKNKVYVNRVEAPVTTTYSPLPSATAALVSFTSSVEDYGYVDSIYGGAGATFTSVSNSILEVGTLSGVSGPLVSSMGVATSSAIVKCSNNSSTGSGIGKWFLGSLGMDCKLYIHDYNGVGGAAVVAGGGSTSGANVGGVFELQSADVNTPGSKAWKYSLTGSAGSILYGEHTLKLASVAAEANKLVTITCYVKKSANFQNVGIKVPAVFLPGYTTDISTSFTGTVGTYQQLTITFTPTTACVFDLLGFVNYTVDTGATDVVWDDLSITQAA